MGDFAVDIRDFYGNSNWQYVFYRRYHTSCKINIAELTLEVNRIVV